MLEIASTWKVGDAQKSCDLSNPGLIFGKDSSPLFPIHENNEDWKSCACY